MTLHATRMWREFSKACTVSISRHDHELETPEVALFDREAIDYSLGEYEQYFRYRCYGASLF